MRRTSSLLALALLLGIAPAGAEPVATLPPEVGPAVASNNVALVATFPDITAIGAKRLGDHLYVTGVDGLAIYDVATTGLPILMGRLPLPHWENEDVDTNGEILLIAADHFVGGDVFDFMNYGGPGRNALNVLYVIDVSLKQVPRLLSRVEVPSSHTATCVLNCKFAWLAGASGIDVIDLRNPSRPKVLGNVQTWAGYTHDVQVDQAGIAWVSGSGGLEALRPRSLAPLQPMPLASSNRFDNNFIIHNSFRPFAKRWKKVKRSTAPLQDGELVYVTEEDWLAQGDYGNEQCARDGSFQTGRYRKVGNKKATLVPLGKWNLGQGTSGELMGAKKGDVAAFCSSHYFDVRAKVAAVAWYEQGVRFLSANNPKKLRQVGFWRPFNSVAWSAMYVGDYVYVFDFARGLDVLHFTGSAKSKASKTWLDPAKRTSPDPTWGYACRLPAV